ncbi:hypothetical protein SK3146_00786 [Paenibacillus konkukensis]|uniref:HNH endonuclease n=1 Tax=Paenibacillus konkukensis TaxID=2020716 RepID=A0ABY4RHL1_9BACL|nr:hypothetical protein SK3146_00786 [Paenibacillus konkukensis]
MVVNGTILSVAVIVIILAVAGCFAVLKRRRTRNRNIVRMAQFKKRNEAKQKCSYCKKKTDRITFYAGVHGSVVGVCRECKPKAERQDLMPI